MRSEYYYLTLDPVLIVDRERKTLGVYLPQVGAEVGHQLPVGEGHQPIRGQYSGHVTLYRPIRDELVPVSEEHHLGAGHVEGVGPVPAVVQEVLQTVELRLYNGKLTPTNRNALAGRENVGTRIL